MLIVTFIMTTFTIMDRTYSISLSVYGCPDNVRVYTTKGQRPTLNFSVVLDTSMDIATFTVTRYDKRPCLLINYENGQPRGSPVLQNGCTMAPTADLSMGILDVQLGTVADGDQGTYYLTETSQNFKPLKCSTLYFLGIPTKPTIADSESLYVGTSLTLTCSSTSTTSPSNHSLAMRYSWTWQGSVITTDGRFSFDSSLQRHLAIANLARNDDQIVIGCTATEERGKTSQSIDYTIVVSYGPENIQFKPTGDSKSYNDGDDFTPVTCLADCHPDCNFSWEKGSTIMSSTEVLDLGGVNAEKLGTYTCTATHTVPGHALTKTLNVSVIYGPTTVTLRPSTMNYTKNEGDTLAPIICSADCFPACNILWRKTSGVSAIVGNDGTLSMDGLDKMKRGLYTCEATNPNTHTKTTSLEVTVNVRYGPDVVKLNETNIHKVIEGDAVNDIDCSADCWPGCVFTWTNLTDNQPMSSSAVLVFGAADRYDTGDYMCMARNSANQFQRKAGKNFTLIVQYAPDVFISLSTTTELLENTPLDIQCEASGVPTVYSYTGFVQQVGGVVVPNSHTGSTGLKDSISVNIPSLQFQDTGLYTCYVHNGITGLNKQLIQTASRNIVVSASPQFFLEETNFAGETSGNITIAIPFVSSPGYTKYSVLRYDGQPISFNGKYTLQIRNESVNAVFYGRKVSLTGKVLQIMIGNLSEKDFGIYKIQITNVINTAMISIKVKATSKPSQPTELNLTSMDNIVTLEWKKGFNGGHEQSFVLQTSLNSDDSWKNKTIISESEHQFIKENGRFHVNVTNLVPGIHSARIVAFNRIGAADPVAFKEKFEIDEFNEEKSASGALIGGVVGGILGVTVLAVVIVVIFLKKRKTQKGHDDNNRLKKGQKMANLSHRTEQEEDNIPEEIENPTYICGDGVTIPKVTAADIYARPDKSKPKQNKHGGDIYSIVDKEKKNQGSGNIQMNKGDNYAGNYSKKKRFDTDRLAYADIVFANPPKGQKKLVVHSTDDMTEYAEVDLTKWADPLPDSDDEHDKK